eukprot:TRINITY_DN15771_c0_g1_i1.p1 TRINITY_DN15771_c0_g1~~TRINITY_DN15771_c0_g1_i1.p1  ORF type:complete len:985 (+),score=263.35 TRINITY_DN15771_c0_g1_i1:65-2956(+)
MIADGLVERALSARGSVALGSKPLSKFCCARNIDVPVRVRILCLRGLDLSTPEAVDRAQDLCVSCELWSNGQRLCLPARTSGRSKLWPPHRVRWHAGDGDGVVFPVHYRNLPLDTILACTIWAPGSSTPLGGTSVHIFSTKGQLKRGYRRLKLHPGQEAQGTEPCGTLGKITQQTLSRQIWKHLRILRQGQVQCSTWLDKLFLSVANPVVEDSGNDAKAKDMTLEMAFDGPLGRDMSAQVFHSSIPLHVDPRKIAARPAESLLSITDLELEDDNPCEGMAARLMSSSHRIVDPRARPNRADQGVIQRVLKHSPLRGTTLDEAEMLWKYRHWLQINNRGFVKFMKCVTWSDKEDVEMATQLIEGWGGITLEDCLELLGRSFSGLHQVRRHAVDRLSQMQSHELSEVLLQLIQGLRYETDLGQRAPSDAGNESALFQLLLDRATSDWILCNKLYWYLFVETHDPRPEMKRLFSSLLGTLKSCLVSRAPLFGARIEQQRRLIQCFHDLQEASKAQSDRTKRAKKIQEMIAQGGCGISQCFARYDTRKQEKRKATGAVNAAERVGMMLVRGGWKAIAKFGHKDGEGGEAEAEAAEEPEPGHSSEHLRQSTAMMHEDVEGEEPEGLEETVDSPAVFAPSEPGTELCNMVPDGFLLFKSAKMPMMVKFIRAEDIREGPHRPLDTGMKLIYKSGDDIRQDQLVLQFVAVIDRLLRADGLDLKLMPYKALALSPNDGMMEAVPNSTNLQEILSDIWGHLRSFECNWPAPGEKGEFEGPVPGGRGKMVRSLNKRCLDNWTKSNAGYAIITFVLGIGDRHLENLMVTNDGRLFHIDFGFILGRDPKPFPPPLKLRQEQVKAMGGTDHPRFAEFQTLCCTAYNIVRKHANLIINLLQMMVDANIPDLSEEKGKEAMDDPNARNMRIQSVEDKLRLDLNEAEATKHMQDILDEAMASLFGRLNDKAHIWAGKLKT